MLTKDYDKAAAWAIIQATAKRFDVTTVALLGRSRRKNATYARFAAAALVREQLGLSYPQMGVLFDRDHHTTMMQMVKRARRLNLVPPKGAPCSEVSPHCEGRSR